MMSMPGQHRISKMPPNFPGGPPRSAGRNWIYQVPGFPALLVLFPEAI